MNQFKRELNEAIEKSQSCYRDYNEHTQDYNTYYDEESRLENISQGVIESFSKEELTIINYVKKRLKEISKYNIEFFQERALDKLILKMYKVYNNFEVDEKLVDDILDYLEGGISFDEEKQKVHKKKVNK